MINIFQFGKTERLALYRISILFLIAVLICCSPQEKQSEVKMKSGNPVFRDGTPILKQ
jgi:hypothetical protein